VGGGVRVRVRGGCIVGGGGVVSSPEVARLGRGIFGGWEREVDG